jgi:hypothetical protein
MSAHLILAIIAGAAIWAGRLYLRPFGPLPQVQGHRPHQARPPAPPGLPPLQGPAPHPAHRLPHHPPPRRKIRDGQRAAARYQQEDSHGDS